MAISAKNKKSSKADSNPSAQLSLVMNGHNPFWKSDLFDRTYLENDVPIVFKEMWELDEAGAFYEFTNDFMNLCTELKSEKLSSWNEQNTINKVIKPVLRMLGYFDKCSQFNEPYLENEAFTAHEHGDTVSYRPDLVLVDDPKELKHIQIKKGDEKLEKAQKFVIVPFEAKYWERISDKESLKAREDKKRVAKAEDRDETSAMEFDDQILKYMEILEKDYGILSDGKIWRLYNREISGQNKDRYFEFNLGQLMYHVQGGIDKDQNAYPIFLANAKYFYHIFSKKSLYGNKGKDRFVDQLLEFSKKYVSQVEEDLKDRFVKAMSLACNGFKDSADRTKEQTDIELIRNVAESHLFNILFIRFCEVRNILPVKQDPTGYRLISISNILDKLENLDPEYEEDGFNLEELKNNFKSFQYSVDGFEIYESLIKLTKIVQDGSNKDYNNFEIEGFKESIYSKDEWKFALNHKLTNKVMVNILFQLGYSKPEIKIKGRTYQQIPYNFFSPRQLGSIYESFLEFKIDIANIDMAFFKKQWKEADLNSSKVKLLDIPKVTKGQLYFTPNNKDRKAAGAYYTPDYIVRYIVRETIGPQVKSLTSKDLLKFKVLDPAMGSGHFLTGVVEYLATLYLEKLKLETLSDVNLSMTEAKRDILHNCIFGIDINSRAVKLAKMSLWLESASSGYSLEQLDKRLVLGNSLADNFKWEKVFEIDSIKFNAIVMNPPYIGENDQKNVFDDLRSSEIWNTHQGKMDYWYFFVHKAVEILCEKGRLGFIATDYWRQNEGAKKLRELLANIKIEQYMSFGEFKVFESAKGQHNMLMILSNQKVSTATSAFIMKTDKQTISTVEKEMMSKSLRCFEKIELSTDGMFHDNSGEKGTPGEILALLDFYKGPKLGNVCSIGTGIQPGPDTINSSGLERIAKGIQTDLHKGRGVFVVTSDEFSSIKLNSFEKQLAKPFLSAKEIKNGKEVSWSNGKHIFYSTKETVSNESQIPNLISFIKPAKLLMDERRETANGKREWFHLHWPRETSFFETPGIVAVRMTKEPVFAWTNGGIYFDLAVNIIVPNNSKLGKAIFLYLQSDIVEIWLKKRGKVKGGMLQVDGKPLREIPVPDFEQMKGAVTMQTVRAFSMLWFQNSVKKLKAAA